jgi:hypothetical protein
MENHDDKRQQLLLDILINKGAAQPPETAAQLLQPWLRMAAHLRPLIGESGFCALYGRSIRLAAREFACLAQCQPGKSIERTLAGLGEAFGGLDPDTASKANATLLGTFITTLSDLIGAALTSQVLSSAAKDGDEQKNAQEHK